MAWRRRSRCARCWTRAICQRRSCLENSVEDTRDLRVAIALDWVRAHLEPYLAFTGGNAAVEDLLTATDRFQSDAEGTPPDARFDYCGRPLGTGGVLPADTLLSEADRLAATLADLDDTPTIRSCRLRGE
jgi:hypothetical protein